MTTAVKIHRQDEDKPEGVAVCGRKAAPGRITDDPGAVTCVVCRTFAEEAREAIAPPRAPRKNALDRLVETASGDVVDMTRDARSSTTTSARRRTAAGPTSSGSWPGSRRTRGTSSSSDPSTDG